MKDFYKSTCLRDVSEMAQLLALGTVIGLVMQAFAAVAEKRASGIFVFGDSLVDVGNNNLLRTRAKANFLPYGINFNEGVPTGRFCDGRLIPDFIALYMGIPHAPAYLQAPEEIQNGVNFGSASSGILPRTGRGQVLSFERQVDDFQELKARLHANLGEIVSRQIVSNAIFYICTGNNDINDLFRESKRSIGLTLELKNRLLLVYRAQLQRLYNLGARKFVVVSVTPVGCVPINQVHGGACDPIAKDAASQINEGLTTMLEQIKPYLPGANLFYCNLFNFLLHVVENPTFYGFTSSNSSCCDTIQQPVILCASLVAKFVNTHLGLSSGMEFTRPIPSTAWLQKFSGGAQAAHHRAYKYSKLYRP